MTNYYGFYLPGIPLLHFHFQKSSFAGYVLSGWQERARKETKATEKKWDKQRTNRKVGDIKQNMSAIILNVSRLNTPVER